MTKQEAFFPSVMTAYKKKYRLQHVKFYPLKILGGNKNFEKNDVMNQHDQKEVIFHRFSRLKVNVSKYQYKHNKKYMFVERI